MGVWKNFKKFLLGPPFLKNPYWACGFPKIQLPGGPLQIFKPGVAPKNPPHKFGQGWGGKCLCDPPWKPQIRVQKKG